MGTEAQPLNGGQLVYIGPEKRHLPDCDPEECEALLGVEKRFNDHGVRMERIENSINELKAQHIVFEAKLDANTKTTEKSAANNAEILDTVTDIKDLVKGTKVFGAIVKWACGIAAAVVGLWMTIKYGKPP